MKNFVIGEVVRDLALRREQEAREQRSGADWERSAKDLESSIVDDIRTLMIAGAIAPVHSETKNPAATDLPIDANWHLNRRDFERVQRYAWQNQPEIKKRILDEFTAVFHDGRYKLGDAGNAFEIGTGERCDQLVEKLKAAALCGDLPMYEPGRIQRYVYVVEGKSITHVRDFHEEAYWQDLNAWLDKHERRITFRFPPPNLPGQDAIDSTATTPGMRALLLQELGAPESKIAAEQAEAPPAQQAWPWQEDQIIRATKSLEYDPLALPPDDRRSQFYVKSLIRARCAKNHPIKMRKALFDKAWERMMGGSPPTLKYAK